jgi:hypothetical protein
VSNNNHSQMWATFTDYDDNHSPYDGRALRVRVSGDVLFLNFGNLKEERTSETFQTDDEHSVGVDAQAFYEALGTILRRSDREASDRLVDGTLSASDPSITAVPVTSFVPAVQKRA